MARELSDKVSLSVHRFLFASDPSAKQKLQSKLHAELDKYEKVLNNQCYLLGDQISLADCVLWPTLIRMDNSYSRQFGLEGKSIRKDCPNLHHYIQRIGSIYARMSGRKLSVDANLPEVIRMYWESSVLAPKTGNDPKSPVPETIPVFD